MSVGGQSQAPATLHQRKSWYPLYRKLGGPQVWSGRVRNNSPPPGFDSWTVQVVASRYTVWAIPARKDILGMLKNKLIHIFLKRIKTRMSNNFRNSWKVLQAVPILNTLEYFKKLS